MLSEQENNLLKATWGISTSESTLKSYLGIGGLI